MNKKQVPNKISEFRYIYKSVVSKKLKEYGVADLDTSYGHIIFNLLNHDKLTMKQISQSVNRDKSTITVLVRNLEQKGYVEKQDNPKDQRSKYIVLTEKGKSLEKAFEDISVSMNQIMWKDIEEKSEIEFMSVLEKLIQNLEENNSN